MSSTKLILLRHGETEDNKNHVFQGQAGHGVNARGREQAGLLAARLANGGIRLHALYTSDLERACDTAAIVGSALSLAPVIDTGLREIDLGAWQGLGEHEVAARFPEEWAAWWGGKDIKRGGGESYAELGERVARSASRIVERHRGETIGAVSHGAAIKVFAARVLGIGAERLHFLRSVANTSVNLFEFDDEGCGRLVIWNDAAHLGDPVVEALRAPP